MSLAGRVRPGHAAKATVSLYATWYYDVAAQIRTLRTLIPVGLVVETQTENGEARFVITDAGRRLVEADGAR
jgi:predicted transcriptional regulator